ncbi:hypothetical protein O3P69_019820 [Scylla paramamosain]|uniref:SMB domain-containing protein n=1 Tax=Scylla paramamosain TaxID=85552 RepID=A0AAW0S9Z1_SCYPA
MIASCGAAWQDYKVQAQCFRGTTIPDAFMGVPYTNPFTNRTYVNAYCAICNGEDPTRLDPWLFSLVCEDARRPLYRPDHYDGVYFDSVDHHIVYFSDGTSWDSTSSTPFNTATLLFSVSLQRCGPEEVLELESDLCRKVICPRLDDKFRKGRCVTVPQGATVSTRGAAINTQGPAAPYCAVRHSCAVPWLSDRGCRCDASCREYGDCCRDSHHYDEAQQMKNFASHTCVAGPTPAYTKTKCSEDWGDEEVLALCLKGNKTPGGSGSLFPVTSTTTAHTYIDHHCAICSGEDPAHPTRVARSVLSVQIGPSSISAPDDEDYSIVFGDSDSAPGDVKNYTRECDPELVATCGPEAQEHQRVFCQPYVATVYQGSHAFRNQHCTPQTTAAVTLSDSLASVEVKCGTESGKHRKIFCSAASLPISAPSAVHHARSPPRTGKLGSFFTAAGTSTTTGPGTAAGTGTTTWPGTAARTGTTTGPGTAARDRHHHGARHSCRDRHHHGARHSCQDRHHHGARHSCQDRHHHGARHSCRDRHHHGARHSCQDRHHHGARHSCRDKDSAGGAGGGAAGEGLGDCPGVLPPEAEFIRQTDGSLQVPAQGRTYHAGEYEGAEGGVLVYGSVRKLSAALGWVSTVGLSLSCLARALHLAAFCVAPSLRNLAGKCLASLCVALLAACGAVLTEHFSRTSKLQLH